MVGYATVFGDWLCRGCSIAPSARFSKGTCLEHCSHSLTSLCKHAYIMAVNMTYQAVGALQSKLSDGGDSLSPSLRLPSHRHRWLPCQIGYGFRKPVLGGG